MNILKNKKLTRCLANEATCRKKYGKEITTSLFKLIEQLSKVVDVRQLFELPGCFHRLSHLPVDNVYAVTLRHPFRCIMSLDAATSTITLEQVCDYHGHYEKFYRK